MVYNFAAGPSMLFKDVLKKAQEEMLDYQGTGMSVAEMSHRSKTFDEIHNKCKLLLKELLNVPDNYEILLLQGGASTQFAMVPLNLTINGIADYVVTGNFANKAYEEAKRFTNAKCIASSKESTYTYIPNLSPELFTENADYVHITSNNTIFGTRYAEYPTTKAPLVCDMSSDILSRKIDVNKFALIYAGAQKNISGAGLTVVIIRKDMLDRCNNPICPTMLNYKTHADAGSLYNTPPCYSIYLAMLTLQHLKDIGGVEAIQKINEKKAEMLYDYIDNSGYYINNVAKKDRSIMNVPFVTGDKELDAKFVAEATKMGLTSLKGHKLVGGMRASIYNAMPIEGVEALISFMKKFAEENKK